MTFGYIPHFSSVTEIPVLRGPETPAEKVVRVFREAYLEAPDQDPAQRDIVFPDRKFSRSEFYTKHLAGPGGMTIFGRQFVADFLTYEPLLEEKGFH